MTAAHAQPEPRNETVPALRLENLAKRFGKLNVLENISTSVQPGERRGILGPNGAGKTTLFNMIAGELAPSGGKVYLFGQEITRLPAHRRATLGLSRTFQTTTLFPKLSCLENVMLSIQAQSNVRFQALWHRAWNKPMVTRAHELLERVGLEPQAERQVRFLSHGEQRQLEILLAVAQGPKVLLLDEPTAGLAPGDVPLVTNMLKALGRDVTIVIIEHDMGVVFDLVDTITVLHYGQVIAEGTVEEVRRNATVQETYLGGKL